LLTSYAARVCCSFFVSKMMSVMWMKLRAFGMISVAM
jgi:hypothetical protein